MAQKTVDASFKTGCVMKPARKLFMLEIGSQTNPTIVYSPVASTIQREVNFL